MIFNQVSGHLVTRSDLHIKLTITLSLKILIIIDSGIYLLASVLTKSFKKRFKYLYVYIYVYTRIRTHIYLCSDILSLKNYRGVGEWLWVGMGLLFGVMKCSKISCGRGCTWNRLQLFLEGNLTARGQECPCIYIFYYISCVCTEFYITCNVTFPQANK